MNKTFMEVWDQYKRLNIFITIVFTKTSKYTNKWYTLEVIIYL